ncbi:MAG: IS3 family transposase [Chitinispirillaceae bacterium]
MQRKSYSPEFKSKMVQLVLSGEMTTAEIAKKYQVHPLMLTKWKKHALGLMPTLFSRKITDEKEQWKQREAQLFQQIGQLQFELEWLKKKTDLSIDEKRSLIDPLDEKLSISAQCRLLGLARSTHYHQCQGESEKNVVIMHSIDRNYTRYPFYGSRRMTVVLNQQGFKVNRKRVQRLMGLMGIEAIYPKPSLSARDKQHSIYPYLLRDMTIERVNQVWGVDITYLRLAGGFAYLTAFIDWFSRFVLSFEISTTLDHQFCVSAFNQALEKGTPEINNSDQGAQFTAQPFIDCVLKSGAKVSMDGRGRALDNVFTERLWRTVKYEDVYPKDYQSPREAMVGLREYFNFYNNERPHQSLKYRTPAEVYFASTR